MTSMADRLRKVREDARQAVVAATFVQIAHTLVDDFDVIDVLTVLAGRCVELFDAAAAGVLLADASGSLRVMAASSEEIKLLELFQIQNDEGPSLTSYHSGEVVIDSDLRTSSRWPAFAAESVRAGFPSVCALPMRLRENVLGCLNLFMSEQPGLSNDDVILACALADVASIAIVQAQANRDAAVRESQLQHALESRIAIEQAKGMIAERGGVDMNEAFARLRDYSRSQQRRLSEVAGALVAGQLNIGVFRKAQDTTQSPQPSS